MKDTGINVMLPADNAELLAISCYKYYGWLIYALNSVSTGARVQQFYYSFVLQYYGLSFQGLDLNGRFGYGSKRTYFNDMVEACKGRSASKTRCIIYTYIHTLFGTICLVV